MESVPLSPGGTIGSSLPAAMPDATDPEADPIPATRLDDLMAVLLETPWLGGLDESCRPARAKLLDLLSLPAGPAPPHPIPPIPTTQPNPALGPLAVMVKAEAPRVEQPKEDITYKELVGEMGY